MDRVLSGMRPTGRIHLGNYFGALRNWIDLQKKYDCVFFIADYHALTTGYETPGEIQPNIDEMALDFLASGLDPEKSVLFVQSHAPAHAEAHLLMSMTAPLAWVERNPSYKEMLENIKDRDLRTYGFLGYPVLQAVDICLYGAKYVPVGQDQVPHIELARELIRRFNHLFKTELIEPEALLTKFAHVPGLDGRKMSKSYGNTIEPFADPAVSRKRIMSIVTDSTPVAGPKNPDTCSVFGMLALFCSDEEKREWADRYRAGGMGYGDAKKALWEKFERTFVPLCDKRESYRKRVREILREGARRAVDISSPALENMKSAMGLGPVAGREARRVKG